MFSPSNVPSFAKNAELSATTLALAGNVNAGGGMKRVSIKGGVFRLLSSGKEVASIEDRHLDVIIVKAAFKLNILVAGEQRHGLIHRHRDFPSHVIQNLERT